MSEKRTLKATKSESEGVVKGEVKMPNQNKENEEENPPKRRSTRLTRNQNSMAEDVLIPAKDLTPEKKLPFVKYRGKIQYLTEAREIAEASDFIMQWVEKQTHLEIVPMSFDMEWPFSFQTGPGKSSTIQICVEEKICYVFHLTNLKKLPPALTVLLTHPKVRLHGVNIKADFRKLARDFPEVNADILIKKCVDLSVWYNRVHESGGRWSLERLANVVIEKGMDKSKKVRMSKWHIIPLDENQLMYAAIDVYIGQMIYRELEKREKIKILNEQQFITENGETAFKAMKTLGETFLKNKDEVVIKEQTTLEHIDVAAINDEAILKCNENDAAIKQQTII